MLLDPLLLDPQPALGDLVVDGGPAHARHLTPKRYRAESARLAKVVDELRSPGPLARAP
jgi:hypothetical protein